MPTAAREMSWCLSGVKWRKKNGVGDTLSVLSLINRLWAANQRDSQGRSFPPRHKLLLQQEFTQIGKFGLHLMRQQRQIGTLG